MADKKTSRSDGSRGLPSSAAIAKTRKFNRAQAHNALRRLEGHLSPGMQELANKLLALLAEDGSAIVSKLHATLFPAATSTKIASAQLSNVLRAITEAATARGLSLEYVYEGAKDKGTEHRQLWFTGPAPTPTAETEGLSAIPPGSLITGQTGLPIGEAPKIVLVTFNENEFEGVRTAFWSDTQPPRQRSSPVGDGLTISADDLGFHNGTHVFHHHSRQGNRESQRAASELLRAFKPVAIIGVGIAFGVDETKQNIGEVLVAEFLVDYELARVNQDGGFTLGGARPPSSRRLFRAMENLDIRKKNDANVPDWPKVVFGGLLTGEKLVDNLDYRERLKKTAAQGGIVGGEMEAAGISKALEGCSTDWIVVKAICDFADGKKGDDKTRKQKLAAANAASVIKALLLGENLYPDATDNDAPSTAGVTPAQGQAELARNKCVPNPRLDALDPAKPLAHGQYGQRTELHDLSINLDVKPSRESLDADPRRVVAFDDILAWLSDADERPLYALLGEYGMGKTTTLQRITEHLRQQRANGIVAPAPLYFDLRKVDTLLAASAMHPGQVPTLQETINDCLRNGYLHTDGVAPTYEDVIDTIDSGAVVIFDGLDEVLSRIGDKQGLSFTANLLRILPESHERKKNRNLSHPPRVVLSCRTQFFRTLDEQDNHFTGEHRGAQQQSRYRALLLQPLTDTQIRRYLAAVFPQTDIDELMAKIEAVHNLRELAGRPFTLKLVADFVPLLEQWRAQGKRVTGATLYREVAKQWLIRDKEKQTFQPEDKLLLASDLAAHFWRNKIRGITAKQLESWLGKWLAEQSPTEDFQTKSRDLLQEDLRNSTFLKRVDGKRKAASRFEFAHTSLQEFFLAEYLLRALTCGDADARSRWCLPMVSDETLDFLGQLLAEHDPDDHDDGAQPLATLATWRAPYCAGASELLLNYARRAHQMGWPLPMVHAMDLRGADLSDWHFGSADEAALPATARHTRFNLARSDFTGAVLRRAKFWNVDLTGATFDGAACEQAEFLHCELATSAWRGTQTAGTQVRPRAVAGMLATWQPPAGADSSRAALAWVHGHSDWVFSCAFSPSGEQVLSASHDKTLRLWDAATGALLREFSGHSDPVLSCAFSPSGEQVLSASHDKTLRLWDAATGALMREFSGHSGPVWSCAFSPSGEQVLSASSDNTLRLWDAATGALMREFSGHSGWVFSCAFSPSGEQVLSASHDKKLRLWDAATGALLREFSGHPDLVFSCAFSPSGEQVLSASDDNTLRLWDAATGALLREFSGHSDPVLSCAFSPSGEQVLSASSDNTLRLWHAATGALLREFSGHGSSVLSCAFSPSGEQVLSASSDNTLRLWHAATGALMREFSGHSGTVRSCAFSPSGEQVLSASNDKTLRLWDAATGALLREFSGHSGTVRSCAFSPSGEQVLSASGDKTLRLWDAATGALLREFSGHSDSVLSCAFSPSGEQVLSASDDNTLRLWDAATGALLREFSGHPDLVFSCAFSPSGEQVLSASDDNTLRLWDAATGALLREFSGHSDPVLSCAFSPSGEQVLSASNDKTLRLWDAATGALLREFSGHSDPVLSCAFSPSGEQLLSASSDNTLRLWDAATGALLREFSGHSDSVLSCAFSPSGEQVLSASRDNTLRLWDASTSVAQRASTLLPGGSAAWVPDSSQLIRATGNAWRFLKWRAPDETGWPVVWQLSPDELTAS